MSEEEKPVIFYLDDTTEGRRDLKMQLRCLFNADFAISELPLERAPSEYVRHLSDIWVAGLFIDQNLHESGEISGYSGVKLAGHLRTFYPEMPIYLVTGHPIEGELESEEAGNADSVVKKGDLVIDTQTSLRFRKQFLRRVQQYQRALSDRQNRFRELLAKKFNDELSESEAKEYGEIKSARELPTNVSESPTEQALTEQLDKIKALIERVDDLKHRGLA
jgi:hypothetical protein